LTFTLINYVLIYFEIGTKQLYTVFTVFLIK